MPAADQPEGNQRPCVGCGRDLPPEAFPYAKSRRCTGCDGNRRRKNRGQSLQSHVAAMLSETRHRAKKKQVDCTLTTEQVLALWAEQGGRCAISGMPLTHHRRGGSGTPSPSNASLDRISPRGPYNPDNVHLVCSAVNMMRRTLELDEFVVWCRQIADHQTSRW